MGIRKISVHACVYVSVFVCPCPLVICSCVLLVEEAYRNSSYFVQRS